MESEQQPEPGVEQKANWRNAILLMVVLVVLLAFGTYINYTQGKLAGSPDAASSSDGEPTATPAPTLTFAQWESAAETVPYDTLLSQGKENEGKTVFFRGQVGHIASETETYVEMWVYVSRGDQSEGYDEDQVVLHYRDMTVGVAVDDVIAFVAVMDGIDAVHQVPELTVKALEVE